MYSTIIKYFSFFIFLTLFSFAGGDIDKPSKEEAVKDKVTLPTGI
jgi:hypothetical protein